MIRIRDCVSLCVPPLEERYHVIWRKIRFLASFRHGRSTAFALLRHALEVRAPACNGDIG
ncbi:hypothetical protein WS66_31020 [Burkholderia sp. LA-2-3-30-S1-D2]|nr:hypothetical protein WS66_31020 [Burkholderia sp. LA-2-3-30-S1-D2]KVE19003.1 hypothetical protein WS66_29580 [Burkholderia sp. LA-2-3-30-S1-D2]